MGPTAIDVSTTGVTICIHGFHEVVAPVAEVGVDASSTFFDLEGRTYVAAEVAIMG